jgi:predicted 3-demethylubiquinone-9 3-methyltransferase (glyoxalase superfamily)
MPKISPCLWFDSQAEEAAKFYASIFRDSELGEITRFTKQGFEIHGQKEGTVLTAEFALEGMDFVALNGGPIFKFNEAVSFQVICDTQTEIDYYWSKLSDGGDAKAQQCGWLKDRFGLSWQVVPAILPGMLRDKDKTKAGRVMTAVLGMKKLDIAELERAYAG